MTITQSYKTIQAILKKDVKQKAYSVVQAVGAEKKERDKIATQVETDYLEN